METLTQPETVRPARVLETLSGNLLDFRRPDSFATTFDEIALVLTRMPILLGHQVTLNAYTIAHHCLWVMRYVLWRTGSPRAALYALTYRAHEAYMGCIPVPVKDLSYLSGPLAHLEARLQQMVYDNMGLAEPPAELVATIRKAADIAEALEAEKFLPSRGREHGTRIPEAAREIAWDHCSADQLYGHMLEAYQVLCDALRDEELVQ